MSTLSICRYCNGEISWDRISGSWKPSNRDGSPHHCNGRRRIHDVNHQFGGTTVGANYTPACGQCEVPAWEVCACSFPEARAA